jgi:hypothetical protein
VGLDQFAQRFFATHGSVESISTYIFQDVCDTFYQQRSEDLKPGQWLRGRAHDRNALGGRPGCSALAEEHNHEAIWPI